jgi:phosphoglucosamine mutase
MSQNQAIPKIFGTDGVRGRANVFPMVVEVALALGKATAKILKSQSGKKRVVIGKDTRLSCYMFENALIAGLCSMGVDTLMLGPFPTPGVAFITRAYRADAGIVISASHNPYVDNGIKIFSSEGFKISDDWEREIERLIATQDFADSLPADQLIGRNSKVNDADGRYIEFVKATFPKKLSLKGMKISLDCANGAGYKVAPLVCSELDGEVFVIGNKPNGLNINEQCGSLYPQAVQQAVLAQQSDVGIALDGDADRVVLIDEKGQIVDGDVILAICAKDMHLRGCLPHAKVVSTVMCNSAVIAALNALGIEVITSQVGDRHVIQDMLKHDAILGGEQSGHMIFLEQNTTGDGLVSALQVLKIMQETGMPLSDLAALFPLNPQVQKTVKVRQKPSLDDRYSIQQAIRRAQIALGNHGRVLVRYSGTEDICRIMVEGPEMGEIDLLAEQIALAINVELGE